MPPSNEKIIVGSEEWLSLPELGIPLIKARVDSGARTSALHAFNIRSFKRGGLPWVSYEVHPIQNNRRVITRCESEVVDRRTVKSSNGTSEKRYVIRALIQLGGGNWEIEITLTNRDPMGYRMLFGREAMQDRILVDPSSRFRCGAYSQDEVMARYEVTQGIDGLRLGLLASNPRLYTNQRLIEAGEERGHHIRFYNIEHCHIKLDTESPEILYRGGRLLNNLDAVIPRIKRNLTYHGSVLVRQFEGIGVYALNSARAINQTRDRLGAMQMLLQEGLDIPVSGFANTKIETGDLIDMVNGAPLIVKLLNDYQHQGSVLAETRKASESVIKAYKSLDANLLVQEFIREAGGKDLRLFVVDAKVVAAIQRKSAAGEFRADIHRGGSASVVKITSAERRIALKATRILGLKVAGVDIVRSERGPLLVDVTATPGFEAIEDATGKDIAGTLISAVEKKLGWKRPLAT